MHMCPWLAPLPNTHRYLTQRLKPTVSCCAGTFVEWTPTVWAFPGGDVRRKGNDREVQSKGRNLMLPVVHIQRVNSARV